MSDSVPNTERHESLRQQAELLRLRQERNAAQAQLEAVERRNEELRVRLDATAGELLRLGERLNAEEDERRTASRRHADELRALMRRHAEAAEVLVAQRREIERLRAELGDESRAAEEPR